MDVLGKEARTAAAGLKSIDNAYVCTYLVGSGWSGCFFGCFFCFGPQRQADAIGGIFGSQQDNNRAALVG